MTGWQSGGGDQGGWNPNQSFGPEAQTNRYNPDPYANPYGGDPYANPYGTDPYGGAGYDQQQYPPTSGFPTPGYGPPPPPPKRSKLPMVLSLVAIVIIIGAVVAIVLVNRKDNQPVAQNDPTTTTAPSSPSSKGSTSPSAKPSGENGDWLSIDNTADSGLSYQVPADWQTSTTPIDSGLGVQFTGAANYGTYNCEDGNFVRTFAASGDVQGKDGKDLDLATTLEDFAKSFAAQGYGEDAKVDVPTPKEVKIGDRTGMTLTAKVTITNPTKPNCQAKEGEIALVGVSLETEGQPKGVAILAVINDLTGGPADPKPLDPSVTQDILATVKVG